jgi:hypothetical protein
MPVQERAAIFVEAMAFAAAVGVLAFLIALLARGPQRQQAGGAGAEQQANPTPRWLEFTLALILLAAIAAFAIWIISTSKEWLWGGTFGDWRSDTRAIVFAAVMVGLGIGGLVVSFAYTAVQAGRRSAAPKPIEATAEAPTVSASVAPAPSSLRLLGLLGLAVALVLMCWIGLSGAAQYRLIAQLIYPASLGVALLLLFDKATRTWDVKARAETAREWLMCDLLVFLLVLAFLNLHGVAKPQSYGGSFWDILNITLFFVAFWIIDRSTVRGRFLLGYGYLIVAPLLLLIWTSLQGVSAAASWWASIWPFLILAALFFVLEIVTLVSSNGERQTLPAIKDTVFVVLYAVLLIVAAKS